MELGRKAATVKGPSDWFTGDVFIDFLAQTHGASPATRLFVSTGRSAGVRPQDLVGAITGESYLSGSNIGAIEITDRFSLVEVPESAADDVVRALRGTSIKGRKATVRRERYPAR